MKVLYILLAIIFLFDMSVSWHCGKPRKCRRRRRRRPPCFFRPRYPRCGWGGWGGWGGVNVEKNTNAISGVVNKSNVNMSNGGCGNSQANFSKMMEMGYHR